MYEERRDLKEFREGLREKGNKLERAGWIAEYKHRKLGRQMDGGVQTDVSVCLAYLAQLLQAVCEEWRPGPVAPTLDVQSNEKTQDRRPWLEYTNTEIMNLQRIEFKLQLPGERLFYVVCW